jgi:hypothetical protein
MPDLSGNTAAAYLSPNPLLQKSTVSHLFPPTSLIEERLRPGDPYLNYCSWPYEPPVAGVGKLRASALLFQAIADMPHGPWVVDVLQAIRCGIGDFRSVYGIKQIHGNWALEVYVYDYARQNRIVSIERLAAVTEGLLSFPRTVSPQIPYFMFSFDLTEHAAANHGKLDSVHVYIGNPGSDVSSGIAYEFTESSRQLENFYFFFDAKRHQREILDKLTCSVFSEAWNSPISELYRPELKNCNTICLANKRSCDTIYFSGINVDQLLFFIKLMNYPDSFVRFVSDRRSDLDHLLSDVGFDYRVQNGRIQFIKHGIYGVF